jgi:hypothetical protein
LISLVFIFWKVKLHPLIIVCLQDENKQQQDAIVADVGPFERQIYISIATAQ